MLTIMKKIFVKLFLIVFTILSPVTHFAATVDFTFKNTTSSCGTTNVVLAITDEGGPSSKKYQIFSIPSVGPWNYEGATTGSEYTVTNVSSTTTYLVRMVDANDHDSKVVDSDPHTFTIINVNKPTLSVKNGSGTYVQSNIDKCVSSGGNNGVEFQIGNLTNNATYVLIEGGSDKPITPAPDGSGKFTFTTFVDFTGSATVTRHYKVKATVGTCPSQTSDQDLTVNFKLNPTPVLSFAGGNPICMNGDAQQTFNFNVSPNSSVYKLTVNGTAENSNLGLDASGNFSRNLNISFGSGGSVNNKFKITTSNGGCNSNPSNEVTVNVYKNPSVSERGTVGSPIPVRLKSSDGDYDLANAFNTMPSWVKISNASGPGVFSTLVGSKWAVKPDQSPVKEINDAIQYTISNTGANCSISGTIVNTDITIIDDQATLPDFIKPIFPLPICSRDKKIDLFASIKSTAFESLPEPTEINVEVQYEGSLSWTKIVATRNSIDNYNNNILYQFTIEPNRHFNYSIPVRIVEGINPDEAALYNKSYKIPIFPSPEPSISGLPSVTNGDTVYFCSASADTLFMRSNPSGGTYTFALFSKKVDGTYDTTDLSNADIRIPSYTQPSKDDPSLEKFVPAMLFNKHIKNGSLNDFISVIYTGPNPCPGQLRRIFKFKVPVNISFSAKDTICHGDQLQLKVQGDYTVGDTILWAFGDGVKTQSTVSALSYKYSQPGKYFLRFQTIKSNPGETLCNNDIIDSVFVGAKPTAAFDVYNNYSGETIRLKTNSKILVANTSEPKDTITKWNWQFNFPVPAVQGKDVSFKSPDVATEPYEMLHIVTTYWGCKDVANVKVPIFPVDTVHADNFDKEEFTQSSVNGWYHSGQFFDSKVKSSWQNIPPVGKNKKIKPISPGDAAWVTFVPDSGGYRAGEKSWVESPVYDIHNLKLPMLSMNTWANMNSPFDGVSVQFAFCDTTAFGKETWVTLGEKDGEGLNWYNSNSVLGAPGGSNEAWTADSVKAWSLSAYRLDTILKLYEKDKVNRERVRFRIVLGTTTLGQGMDGFAFDNFFVGQRNRKVIVEEFCDYVNAFDKPEKIFVDPQALRIQNHLSDLVEDDSINIQNPYEPSARGLLYGIGNTLPRVVLDGVYYQNDIKYNGKESAEFNKGYYDWINRYLLERSLITSPYTIKLDPKIVGDSLKIETSIVKSPKVTDNKNYVVQVAIVEKVVKGNNGTEFTNVLRKMLPNSAGHRIDKSFAWTSKTINTRWKPTIKPQSKIYIIAFLQDEDTKEIYQAEYDSVELEDYKDLYVGTRPGGPSAIGSFNDLALSPNPTSHDLLVKFDGMLKDDYTWSIIDVLGNQRNTGLMLYGTDATMLNTDYLGTGMYYLKLEGEGRSFIKKFSVVK